MKNGLLEEDNGIEQLFNEGAIDEVLAPPSNFDNEIFPCDSDGYGRGAGLAPIV